MAALGGDDEQSLWVLPLSAAAAADARPLRALPTRPGWSFEPKWDGFRAIVRTGVDYTVRSRRGWRMTEHLPEFASASVRGVFDGEIVAFGNDGRPSFERICRRILQRDSSVPVTLIVFDLLELDGEPTLRLPYRERRETLEGLTLPPGSHLCSRFDDGAALWASVVAHRLEGVVAKRLKDAYRPGERTWIKKKNREWPRYEGAIRTISVDSAKKTSRSSRQCSGERMIRRMAGRPNVPTVESGLEPSPAAHFNNQGSRRAVSTLSPRPFPARW